MQRLDLFQVPKEFRGRSAFICQLWWIVQACFFATSPQFAYSWRRFLLRLFGADIGIGVIVRPTARITYPWKLKIGDYSWVGDHVELYNLGEISIGSHSVVSQKSYVCTGSHDYRIPTFDIHAKPVTIGDDCWLATDVFVAPGITIANGCVVGARSSVFHSLPANSICRGNPAIKIRDRELVDINKGNNK